LGSEVAELHTDHLGRSADEWVSFLLQYGQSRLKAHRLGAFEEAPGSKWKALLFLETYGDQEDAGPVAKDVLRRSCLVTPGK
tara:strand:- start:2330 stop:2575 length:246 start_codon:yes stop_codon:yes gene_type:complete